MHYRFSIAIVVVFGNIVLAVHIFTTTIRTIRYLFPSDVASLSSSGHLGVFMIFWDAMLNLYCHSLTALYFQV